MDITTLLTEKCTSLLIFEISGIEYCLSNTLILSTAKPDSIKQLGTSENLSYSLMWMDNTTVSLIDLKKMLSGEKQKIDSNSRVIIIEYEDIRFGLLVETIKEIIAVDIEFITTELKFTSAIKSKYIQGTIEYEEREFLFLNIEKIVTDIGLFGASSGE